MASAKQRIDELKEAAKDWFKREKIRLNAQFDFLDAISKKRGGAATLDDANADGASKILVNSINEYLDRPPEPEEK